MTTNKSLQHEVNWFIYIMTSFVIQRPGCGLYDDTDICLLSHGDYKVHQVAVVRFAAIASGHYASSWLSLMHICSFMWRVKYLCHLTSTNKPDRNFKILQIDPNCDFTIQVTLQNIDVNKGFISRWNICIIVGSEPKGYKCHSFASTGGSICLYAEEMWWAHPSKTMFSWKVYVYVAM